MRKRNYVKKKVKKTYTLYPQNKTYVGIVRGNKKGFAFLERDNGEDFYIQSSALHGAQHGDKVSVRLIHGDRAEVVRILSRGNTVMIGTALRDGNRVLFIPDNQNYFSNVVLSDKGVKDGEKVAIKIDEYPRGKLPRGHIVKRMGKAGDPQTEELSVIYANGFKENFSPTAEREASAFAFSEEDYKDRRDYRSLLTITIDGDDSKDFDDAISLEKRDYGYVLYVHIADVSHFVREGSSVDAEAYERATSVYLPFKCYPMLPDSLCNNLCSLLPNTDRLAVTVVMYFDENGARKRWDVKKSVIRSDYRMTYSKVKKMLEGDLELRESYGETLCELLDNSAHLASLLKARRDERGSIDFTAKETRITLTENGIEVVGRESDIATSLIEEFMLSANETVAEALTEREFPSMYRVHKEPSADKLAILQSFAESMGLSSPYGDLTPENVCDFINFVKDKPGGELVCNIGIRSMQKAEYDNQNLGHYGLASKCYCHFTSPIRRYPDIVQHRMIKALIVGKKPNVGAMEEKLVTMSAHCSLMERAAEKAEREMADYYKALYMQQRIGKEFDGIISGVISSGIFVELENTVEGFVSINALPFDNYVYNPAHYLLKGVSNSYKLGDKVRIKVVSVNLEKKKIDFNLSE